MCSIFDVLVLDVLEHHVEAVLHVVLRPTWHLLDNLGPFVADAETLLKDENVFGKSERIFLDLWV